MCGRYVLSEDPYQLASDFGAVIDTASEKLLSPYRPNYNVAPTTQVPVVVSTDDAERKLMAVRWGIVPRWARSAPSILVNARGETVAEKATFAQAFAHSRCIIPASGYYEWKRPEKEPYFFSHQDRSLLAMAGIVQGSVIDGEQVLTCAIITLAAAPAISFIHDRMPATISPDLWDAWLDPTIGSVEALSLMAAETDLVCRPVSRRVNSIRNNDSSLLADDPVTDTLL